MRFSGFRWAAGVLAIGMATIASAHELQPGQQLTFVLSEPRPGGEPVAQTYFSGAFPLAQANGMHELTTFRVQKTLYGNDAPQGSGLYSWPSREAAQRSRTDETYVTTLRPLRTQAWKELRSVDMPVEQPLTLELDRTRLYTAALVWTRDAAAYAQTFADSQSLRDRIGARTVLHLSGSRYESLVETQTAPPDHIVILEWPDAAAIEFYRTDPSLATMRAEYEKSIARFDWYQLGFWD